MIWYVCRCQDWYADDGVLLLSTYEPDALCCHQWACGFTLNEDAKEILLGRKYPEAKVKIR